MCAGARGGEGEGRALAEKLVVSGWWLLVNEREGVPRWGKVCATRARGGEGGFITARERRWRYRDSGALADTGSR